MSDERDIVESLRAECDDVYDHSTRIVLRAAADEIERLRAEVARLDGQNSNLRKRLDLIAGWASRIASTTLGGGLPLSVDAGG